MSDKDVTRNVRSSGEEGVETPTEKHYHTPGQKKSFPFGDRSQKLELKKALLEKFREREKKIGGEGKPGKEKAS